MGGSVVLGAGVMGSAFTFPLAASGHPVRLVGTHLDSHIMDALREHAAHPGLGVRLEPGVVPMRHDELGAAIAAGPELVVLGVSSPGIPWAIDRLIEHLENPVPLLLLTKGLSTEGDIVTTLTARVKDAISAASGWPHDRLHVGGAGGPCIAAELAAGRRTNAILGTDPQLRSVCERLLGGSAYRAAFTDDIDGVELAAALKNFFAIGVGTASGAAELAGPAENGASAFNPEAALFTQASIELSYLVEALGGTKETAHGLAGVGDLYVTCRAGRNSRMGRLLGTGMPFSKARREMAGVTVEGADLALEIGPVLRDMMEDGRLDRARLQLTAAIVRAICDDAMLAWPPSP